MLSHRTCIIALASHLHRTCIAWYHIALVSHRSLIQAEGDVQSTLSARAGVLTTEQIAGDAAFRRAQSARVSTLAEARAQVAAAEIAREGARQEAENAFLKSKLEAVTARTRVLSEAEVKRGTAEARRGALLAARRTELLRSEVENARLVIEAKAEADRVAVAADAEAKAGLVEIAAEVEGMRHGKSAVLASYFGLRDAGMNNTEMLRYLYAQTLRGLVGGEGGHAGGGSKVFIDYTKMPMLLEGAVGSASAGAGASGGASAGASAVQAGANTVASRMLKDILPDLSAIASNGN
jgi:hypothetical protein